MLLEQWHHYPNKGSKQPLSSSQTKVLNVHDSIVPTIEFVTRCDFGMVEYHVSQKKAAPQNTNKYSYVFQTVLHHLQI